jgi:hypothetical protein
MFFWLTLGKRSIANGNRRGLAGESGFMRGRGVTPGGLGVNRNDTRHYRRESACGGTLSPCWRFRRA